MTNDRIEKLGVGGKYSLRVTWEPNWIAKAIAALAVILGAVVLAPTAHADWHCQPAYAGVETICTDDNGHQIVCFNWGQAAGQCRDMATGSLVERPPGA